MRIIIATSLALSFGWNLGMPRCVVAQLVIVRGGAVDAMAERIRADGDFLQGAGWYNLRNSQAAAVATETEIRWKEDLRRIQREKYELLQRNEAYKKMNKQERIRKNQEEEIRIRADPKDEDICRGLALNVLLTDLMDPDITPVHWRAFQVALPEGASVKDMVMSFRPSQAEVNGEHALSRGVIALSRLEMEGRWPTPLKEKGLDDERRRYEEACRKLRMHLMDGKFQVEDIIAVDNELNALKSKAERVVPIARNFRSQATQFIKDLRESTLIIDGKTVDYAQEMLRDTAEHDAKTVGELVAFTLKYRLRFASVEHSPNTCKLYRGLYMALREQVKQMGPAIVSTAKKP